MVFPVSTSIYIRFSLSSGLPICRLTEGRELLILTGMAFLRKGEILVMREKIA